MKQPCSHELAALDVGILPALFAASLDAILVADEEGRYVDANPAACELFGMPREELIGRSVSEFVDADAARGTRRQFAEFKQKKKETGLFFLKRPDGERRVLEYSATADFVQGLHVSFLRDVTKRVRAEEQRELLQAKLAKTERMAALGTLATGIAHGINNPLAYVMTYLSLTLEELQEASGGELEASRLEPLVEQLKSATEGLQRVREITRSLKLFARNDTDRVETFDLREVVQTAAILMRSEIQQRAQLIESYEAVPPIRGSRANLCQVVVGLLANAVQAIETGTGGEKRISITTLTTPDRKALLSIEDTGCGMSDEILTRIFEPFFTTKPQEQGKGLGLAISYGIVASMGGEIRVRSASGRGSVFEVILPAA